MQKLKLLIILPLVLFISACAKDISPNTYTDAAVGEASRVLKGVIIDMRTVKVKGNSEVGKVAGGATGAVIGSNIGGGRGSLLGVIGGAVLGGIAGNAIDNDVNTQDGIEYIVDLNSGKSISVVQGKSDLRVGQHVLVIYGKTARIVPDRNNRNKA